MPGGLFLSRRFGMKGSHCVPALLWDGRLKPSRDIKRW